MKKNLARVTCFRRIHTKQEITESYYDEYDLIRPSRRKNNIPNNYDDIRASEDYSWKSFRKIKYQVGVEKLLIGFKKKWYSSGYYEVIESLRLKGFHVNQLYSRTSREKYKELCDKYPNFDDFISYTGIKIRLPRDAEYLK